MFTTPVEGMSVVLVRPRAFSARTSGDTMTVQFRKQPGELRRAWFRWECDEWHVSKAVASRSR